ncbi:MAG TPA: POTRA domain-containing protein [Burkholderiales bacterium]|nr:POTRA domain-containing protein [Burkholderiales bacterium]
MLCAWSAGGAALAQVAPQLPSVDPGRAPERVAPKPAPAPRPALPDVPKPSGEVPDALKSVKVVLKEVAIEGTSLLLPQAQEMARGYVGPTITGADIFELARSLTALYRNAGYLLTVVLVPPQDLSSGRLRLRVVEGYVADVRVEGDPAVAGRLTQLGEKIKASRPLHADDLERYLLLANDLPGVRVRAVLAPSKTPGAADLTLVASVKRIEGYASLDNYGSKLLGPGQFTVGLTGNQVLGINDEWRLVGLTTGNGELNYGQFSYNQVVTAEGLKLGANVWESRSNPGDVLEPLDLQGRAVAGALSAAYPLLRTRNQSVLGRVLFDARNITTDIPTSLGPIRLIDDRIRALRFGALWLAADRLDGQNALDVEFSQGVGGTKKEDPLKSRAGADGKFSKIVLDYERLQRLSSRWTVTLGAAAQWTNEPLLVTEQYALGGRRFGRAYEFAELTGDRALAFRMEPAWLDRLESFAYQVYAFYDLGKVWYQDDPAFGTPRSAQSLASAGFGTRVLGNEWIGAGLELAKPLTRPVASYVASGHGDRARILASLTVRF